MSLINGPKKVNPPQAGPANNDLQDAVKKSVGLAGIRMLENLTGIRLDPTPAYLFYVEISGLIVALFTECSGIGISRSEEKVREGGVNDFAHSLPGPVDYEHIVLERGISASRELWNWFQNGLYDFQVKKVNMSIIQGAPGMSALSVVTSGGYGVVKRWNIENAYPLRWKLSDLSVSNTEAVAVETVEIAHEGISLSPIMGTPMSITGTVTSL